MKTVKIALFAVLGLMAVACSDDDDDNTAKLSSDEQAEMVSSSLGQSGFAGSAEQFSQIAANANGPSAGRVAECGFTNASSWELGNTIGDISFSLAYDYAVALLCNTNEQPERFTADFSYDGSFTSPRFESEYGGTGFLTIRGLSEDANEFEVNGTYDRAGSFDSNVDTQASGSQTIDIDVNDVMVSKGLQGKITSGSAVVEAKGQIDGRGKYSFKATVVFNGDGFATITVKGETYRLNLQNSTIVKIQ